MTGTNNDNEKLNIKDDFSEMFVKLIDTIRIWCAFLVIYDEKGKKWEEVL